MDAQREDVLMVPKTRWATTVDGAAIAYQVVGDADITVVLIHGEFSHLEVFWEQPLFARFVWRLARNFRVLQFDKRGMGMSDRVPGALDLDTRMDDVRAVMDAAGVERAALLAYGYGGPAVAVFFAATQPERTLAVCINGSIDDRRTADFPWGMDEREREDWVAACVAGWGDEDAVEVMRDFGLGSLADDPEGRAWCARFMRMSGTPQSYANHEQMWHETDVRSVLSSVQAPTLVLYREAGQAWSSRERAAFLSSRIPAAKLQGIPGSANLLWMANVEEAVGAVEDFIFSIHEDESRLDRVLATVLFTDIVNSTETASRLGDHAWKQLVERHHATIRALVGRYRGTELDTAGDGFYASFGGPARGVRCAQAIVDAIAQLGLEVRAGVHVGEVDVIDGKPGGMAINIGARIAAKASPSEVLTSQTVKDLVVGSGINFDNRGTHNLKGVPGEWNLYAAVG
jgi:class 3 adenylate cyclase